MNRLNMKKLNDKDQLEELRHGLTNGRTLQKPGQLIHSSMSQDQNWFRIWRNFWIDEVFDSLAPSIFDTSPKDVARNLLYRLADKQNHIHNDNSSFSFKENVKPPRNLCNKSGVNSRSLCKRKSFSSKTCFVYGSKFHLIKDCDFYEKQLELHNKPLWNNVAHILSFIPKAASVPAGSRNRPTSVPAGSRNRPASVLLENPHKNRDLGIVDSGCSRSMTGNKEKLDDFLMIVGGTVTFGGGDGRITGKGTIRSSKLNFENVYYVEELQNFNLWFQSSKTRTISTASNLSDLKPETRCHCCWQKLLVKSTKWHRSLPAQRKATQGFLQGFTAVRLPFLLLSSYSHRTFWSYFHQMPLLQKKDETYGILKDFITFIENQLTTKVKAIRCDNGTEFKNSNLIELCGSKGIRRDYSNARTPQQNGVAERKNRTLIEAARTMLADFKLPTMFWTEAVSTACYVLNKVLVTKPRNKTPYELVSGKVPNISHLKPFGCLVTILNTSDHLGKFEGKADEGFIVGYAAHSTQDTNIHTGTQDDSDSECDEQVIVVPSFPSNSFSGPKVDEASDMVESSSDYAEELARLQKQAYEANATAEKHQSQADLAASRNRVPAGKIDSAAGVSYGPTETSTPVVKPVHTDAPSLPPGHSLGSSEHSSRYPSPSDLANTMSSSSEMEDIHHHPDTGIFSSSSYDDDFGGTITNLAPSIVVDSVPTKRVNTIHPQSQILGDLTSPVQTRGTLKKSKFGASAFVSYVHDQQRNNHTDYLHCLFACFLSQLEPSSVAQALNDPAWVEAMQEEMQQFINQKVWQLVPLPDGKIAIGTKWILKNKRDARGIVVRNKARLVAQGHRQEEGIDYDEVFALVARIEAIRLFLAFASYMGFMVYQMDVKSAFLYGEIEEEVYVTQPKGFEDPHFPKHVYRVVNKLSLVLSSRRAWYARLSTFLLKHNYRRGTIDKTLFIKKNSRDIILVQVYVDDIIFGSTNKAWCDDFEVLIKDGSSCFDSFKPDIQFAVSACSRHQKSTMVGCQFLGRRLISCQCKKQSNGGYFSTEAEYVLLLKYCGQSTASLRASEEGPPAILATIDRTPYTITESLVRSQLQLDDEGGFEDLPIADIYLGSCDQFESQLAIAIHLLTEGEETVPETITEPDHSHDHESTPPRPTTSTFGAPVNESGPSSDPNIASSSRPHESAPDNSFYNVEDENNGEVRFPHKPHLYSVHSSAERITQETELNAHKLLFRRCRKWLRKEEDAEQDVDPLIKLAKAAAKCCCCLAIRGGFSCCCPPARERIFRQKEEDMLDSDWNEIMSQVHANQGLTADLLGPDVNDDNFAERMVALIAKRRRDFAAQRFQDKRNKPMTYAQQKAYMRTFVKNQSSTIYTTGWSMKHVKSFSDDQLKTEFDKIRAAVAELKSLNIKRSLKRPATKEDVEVPFNTASTAQHTASSLKKVGTKKKRLGRKGVHTSQSTIPIEEGDPEAEHKVCIKYASDADSASDDDTPVNLYAVVDWELLPTGLGSINAFYRLDNSRKYFTSLREILHLVTRADLMTIYGRVMTFYQDKKAAGVGLVLWGDLKVLMDSPEVNDGSDVWKNQHTWSIQSWKLYSFSGVHVLETVSGLVLHMFVDKKYPLSVNLIERMLDHQLEICHGTVGNELTTAVQLIAFLKKQISDSKRPKVHDWYCCYNKEWLVQEGTALGKDYIKSVDGCDDLPKIIRLASPRVNGYLVKASSNPFPFFDSPLPGVNTPWDVMRIVCNPELLDIMSLRWFFDAASSMLLVRGSRYVVPTGKDNVIVSAGRTKVIPAGRTILVLEARVMLQGKHKPLHDHKVDHARETKFPL
ncbi:putative ribonuclease H-like domain-containing protein [Tanacetum coccineum]